MPNEPIESSRAAEPELMRLSKARPPSGDLDFAKFAPRKAATSAKKSSTYDTSRYLEQVREDDPWPDEDAFQRRSEIRVTIVTCEITTAAGDLRFDRPVHARCQVRIVNAPDDLSVRLRLQFAQSAAGPWTDLKEVVSRAITAAPADQTLEADLQLSTPHPEPAFGADVFYRAVATNNQANAKESAAVTLKYIKLAQIVGEPEIAHVEHSPLPRLGADGVLVRALGAFLNKIAQRPAPTADKALVLGFSHLESDLKTNRKLSLRRAEVLKSLLDRDPALWEKNRSEFKTSHKQQILSDLHAAFGWDCDPGPVDGISGLKTAAGVRGFQREYNSRYAPRPTDTKLTVDGICGKKTWTGIHRALCALVAKELDPAFADPAPPAWQIPDWHYPAGLGAYPCGADFPPPGRSAELELFHPSDAPLLATPTDSAALTIADTPVEDPVKYRKERLAIRAANGPALPAADRAVPVIETYDPSENVLESGSNPKRVERSGQLVEIRQWVNLTTRDEGRDGKGSKVNLRIRSRDSLRDEAGAKPLPDQVFLKVIYSADGGPSRRSPRNSPDNAFQLNAAANLAIQTSPDAASLARKPAGGWQANPAAPWEYTATVDTAGSKVAEIVLDLGVCGGDTCEVQVGATNACEDARVRFVNWRKLHYELLLPDCMASKMNTATPTAWDFGAGIKNAFDQQTAPGFVQFDLVSSHRFSQAQAGANTWVPAAFVGETTPGDRFIYASKWPAPSGVAFDASPNTRTNQITICHRAFSSNAPRDASDNITIPLSTLEATQVQTDFPVNALTGAVDGRDHSFVTATWDNTPSVNVAGLKWVAVVDPAQHRIMPTLTLSEAPDAGLDAVTYRVEVLASDNSIAKTSTVRFGPASSAFPGAAAVACADSVSHCLEKNFLYACATRTRIVIRSRPGDPLASARGGALRSAIQTEFDARKRMYSYHPGLTPDEVPRDGNMEAAWFSHPTSKVLRLQLPTRTNPASPPLPGDLVGTAPSTTRCPIRWQARVARTYEILGSSGSGSVILVLDGADVDIASTLSHELGHSMGLTPFINGTNDQCARIPGLPIPGHVDNHGRTYFDGNVAGTGIRTLHRGPHCAAGIPGDPGLTDVPGVPDEPAVPPPATGPNPILHATFKNKTGTCIMFGEGVPGVAIQYCGACLSTLKSRTLKNIRSSWPGRF